jgi:glycosyltransferase involved in cell wall biosynthesis
MPPIISIIVPVYNCDNFLKKSITSLVSQTFKNIEIICINDGSKDNSLAILSDFSEKDERIIVINQEKSGPAEARNKGLKKARGEYIMFCDSDDWYEPIMCQKMLETIQSKNVDLVICNCNVVKNEQTYDLRDDYIDYHKLVYYGLHSLTFPFKTKVNSLLWNKIFKKNIIKKYNIDFPSGYYHDDMAFILQYLCCAKNIYAIDINLYNYLLRSDSIMHRAYSLVKDWKKRFDVIDAMKYFFVKLSNNNLLNDNKNYFILMLSGSVKWVINNCKSEEEIICFLDYCNETILFDLDLDYFPDTEDKTILVMIKDKYYQPFYQGSKENQKSNDKKKRKRVEKSIKKVLNFCFSYFLFPYYIYKIYKKM